MAQNAYLQGLLGVDPSQTGMGRYMYGYSLPNYNLLLSKGLNEQQIEGYDPLWSTFKQFPYKAEEDTQLNYPQYGVVPQAPDVDTVQPDTPEEQVTIDYSQQEDVGPSSQEEQRMKIQADFPLGQEYASTMSQFSEPMMMKWAKDKGYIDAEGFLQGPMQTSMPKFSLWGNAMTGPAQAMNNRAYNNWLNQAREMGMFSEMAGKHGEPFGRIRLSSKFNLQDDISNRMNTRIDGALNKDEFGNRIYQGTFAPNISNQDEIVYYTSTGGRYTEDGFVTGNNQRARYGSITDIVDTLAAAQKLAEKGDFSGYDSIPDKFLTDKYKNKMDNAKTINQGQKNVIVASINKFKEGGKVGKPTPTVGPKKQGGKIPKFKDRDEKTTTAKKVETKREKKGSGPSRQQQRVKPKSSYTRPGASGHPTGHHW